MSDQSKHVSLNILHVLPGLQFPAVNLFYCIGSWLWLHAGGQKKVSDQIL